MNRYSHYLLCLAILVLPLVAVADSGTPQWFGGQGARHALRLHFAFRRSGDLSYGDDPVILDRDIADDRGLARSVVKSATANDQVIGRRLRGNRCRQQHRTAQQQQGRCKAPGRCHRFSP